MKNLYHKIINRQLTSRSRAFIGIAALVVVFASLIVFWHSFSYVLRPAHAETQTQPPVSQVGAGAGEVADGATVATPGGVTAAGDTAAANPLIWGADNDLQDASSGFAAETISPAEHAANVEAAKGWLVEAFTWAPGEETTAPWSATSPFESPWDTGVERANQSYGYAERLTWQLSGLDLLRSTSDRVARRHFTVTAVTEDVTNLDDLHGDIWLVSHLTFTPIEAGNPNVILPLTVYSRFQVQNGRVTNALIDSVESVRLGVS